LQLLVEEGAVREAGERVVERHLPQLLVRFALGGDVQEVALEIHGAAVVVENHDALVANPDDAAVLRDQAVLGAERLVRAVRSRMCGEHTLAVVRVQCADEEVAVGLPFLDGVPEQILHLGAREDVRAGGVERVEVDDERELLDESPVAAFDVVVVGRPAVLHR
jgi:hypothetical protein